MQGTAQEGTECTTFESQRPEQLQLVPQFSEAEIERLVVSYIPLADWWSNKIQWCEDDHKDLVQEGLLNLVTTLRGYNKSGKEVRDIKGLAGSCFSASMKWWYKKSDRTLNFIPLEDSRIKIDRSDVYLSEIFIDGYLAALEQRHGVTARKIVEQLLEPGEDVAALALAEMSRKKEQKAAGDRVIGYGSPRIHRNHVREAVGLDTKIFDRTMTNIKVFTTEYMCRNQESVSGLFAKARSESPPSLPSPIAASTMH